MIPKTEALVRIVFIVSKMCLYWRKYQTQLVTTLCCPSGIPPTYIGADSYGAPGGQDWDHVSQEYTSM